MSTIREWASHDNEHQSREEPGRETTEKPALPHGFAASLMLNLLKKLLKPSGYASYMYTKIGYEVGEFRARFLKKIQDWIVKSKNGFCISLLNRLIRDHSHHKKFKNAKICIIITYE